MSWSYRSVSPETPWPNRTASRSKVRIFSRWLAAHGGGSRNSVSGGSLLLHGFVEVVILCIVHASCPLPSKKADDFANAGFTPGVFAFSDCCRFRARQNALKLCSVLLDSFTNHATHSGLFLGTQVKLAALSQAQAHPRYARAPRNNILGETRSLTPLTQSSHNVSPAAIVAARQLSRSRHDAVDTHDGDS